MSRRGRHLFKAVVDLDEGDDPVEPQALAADRGVYFSADGLRRNEELLNISHKKRRLNPTELDDALAEWVPVPDDDFSEEGARHRPDSSTVNPGETVTILGKRKEYISTKDPMSVWRPFKSFFLDEVLRHEGLGDDLDNPMCAHCRVKFDTALPSSPRIFKCYHCGQFLQCETCCVAHHQRNPLHVLLEWNSNFWAPCTLQDLGLVYQLGHGGFPCPFPDDTVHRMTVIEAPIIHQVSLCYCKCEKSDDADNVEQLLRNQWFPATITDPGTCATFLTLEAYRLYNVVGNMNVTDFIKSLERYLSLHRTRQLTVVFQERYKQFSRMARQWAFLKRLERAGRAHDPDGVDSTELGECAVRCWPCPHDGRNLPQDWRDVDPKFRFLFMLILAVDANFRPKNRKRKNEIDDPSLGPGWGYWVEPRGYREHVKKYVNEKDVSTCIAFAALLQKDTRLTTGLRVSGVGGVVCARHECMRPNGIGDLQKGERYANMDYIVVAALAGISLMLLTISYDIACQWKVNLAERVTRLPSPMKDTLKDVKVQCALPVWHAGSHIEDCRDANSLSVKPGVGKTDGEGVERTWSVLNPASFSTKDAGRGTRADTLEAKIDNHNYLKNVGQGEALQRKLVVAIAERDKQIRAFAEVNKTVGKDVKKKWKAMIDAWLEDETQPNPFTYSRAEFPTEAQVRLDVRKDEDALTEAGKAPLHGRSATAFLAAGIQIEDSQRRIISQRGSTVLVAADRDNKIQEWRHALLVKIAKFRTLQAIYMPGVAALIAEVEAARDPDASPPNAEHIQLFMPSNIATVTDAVAACVPGLVDMEAKLRLGQCNNSLVALRGRLHAKRFLIGFRNENVIGQVQSTKARTLIALVGERVENHANRYRKGYSALVALKGAESYPNLRVLKVEDLTLDGDWFESDGAARKKLALIGAGRGARMPRTAPGASRRVMSWIWTAAGALGDGEAHLHDSIRVEWSRARGRKVRWSEEVMLLREEMRRVLRYLGWQAGWWRERVDARPDVSPVLAAGLRAYALKQASWHDRLSGFFRAKWDISALTAAQQMVAVDDVELDNFFGQ
ncbi:hypothetical protein C8R47DRAFT_1181554 [Mycena vitilis]|nr:hypothetical protein C8R47DRAFT_1181554 [Mycena vitilis]